MRPHSRPPEGRAKPLVIGWKEYLDFPDWDLRRLKVKIDTGARTSALDVSRYDLCEDEEGRLAADLYLSLRRGDPGGGRIVRVPVLDMVVVRSSIGVRERRPLIATTIRLGPVTKTVYVTVANRSRMRFRMILGRTALHGDFVVDVSQKYLLRKRSR